MSKDRFDKIDRQLDSITEAIVKGFDRVDKSLETRVEKQDIQRVYDLLDKISKDQEIDNDERLVMGHQLNRMDQ